MSSDASGERTTADPATGATRLRWAVVAAVVLFGIVVPFVIWGDSMEAWIGDWVSDRHPTTSAVLVLGGLLAADVLLPIPSSVVSVAAGMRLGFFGAVATITTGATIGCLVGWGLGRGLARPGLRRFVGPAALARFDALAVRYGVGALLVARPVPVLAEASVIAAGAGRFGLRRTLAWTAAANLLVAVVYAGVGELAIATAHPELALLAALGGPGVAILLARWLPRAWS